MAWVLRFDGQVYKEGDLTIDEAERIEVACATTWRQINPLRSAKVARGILETLLITRQGKSPDEAHAVIGGLKIDEFLSLISFEEDEPDLPTEYENGFPPSAGDPSTPG